VVNKASIAAFVAVLAVGPAWSQALDNSPEAKKAREKLCRQVLCRQPTTVKVLLKDKSILEVPFQDISPIVLPNGWVTVLPGEEIHIVFDVDGDSVRNPRAIAKATGAKNTLSFRFAQDSGSADSLLVVNSTFEHALKFDLGIMLPGSERVLKTSSCPVVGGSSGYEHWPHPVFQIVVARFRVLPPGSPMKCE